MESLADVYNRAVTGAQTIQSNKNIQADYEAAKADEASRKSTMLEAYQPQDPQTLQDSYTQSQEPNLVQGTGFDGQQTAMPEGAMSLSGQPQAQLPNGTSAPMPSFMGGAKAEEAAKTPQQAMADTIKAAPEAPKTPMLKLQATQQAVSGYDKLLKTNDNAIKIALSKGDFKFANELAKQNDLLKDSHGKAKLENLKATGETLTLVGQLADGYEAELKANPNDPERAWQRLRMNTTLEGLPTQALDQAKTPEQRAALIANAQATAVTGKEKVQLEIANLRFTAEQEKTKQLGIIAERKATQADRRLALGKGNMDLKARAETIREIKLRQDTGKPISEAEAAFLNDESDLIGLLANPDTAKAILTGKDVSNIVNEISTTPMQTTTPFAGKIQKLEKSAPTAVSPKGAESSMQVMPATQKDPGYGVIPAKDNSLAEKARVGNDFANAMYKNYNNNETLAAAAYNWGPGNVDASIAKAKKNGVLPEEQVYKDAPQETKKYIDRLNSDIPEAAPPKVAKEGAAKGGEVLRAKLSSADITRNQRAINAGNSVVSAVETIKELPIGTSMGLLPNLTSKDGMIAAIRNAAGRAITSNSEDQLNTVFKGLGRDLAAVETGGLATGLTDLSKSLEQGLGINPGQATPEKVAMKLADIRRIVDEHLQPQIDANMFGHDQMIVAKNIIKKMDAMVPYTTTEVAIATRKASENPNVQTTGEASQKVIDGKQTYPNAPKVGTVEGNHIYLGGNPADKESWGVKR